MSNISIRTEMNSEEVVSISNFKLGKLTDRLRQLEQRNNVLTKTSLDSAENQKKIYSLVTRMLEAGSLQELAKVLQQEFLFTLDIDIASLNLMPAVYRKLGADVIGVQEISEADHASLFKTGSKVILREIFWESTKFVYPAGTEDSVNSDAILDIRNKKYGSLGMLALGSSNTERFYHGQVTESLEFIADVLAVCISRFMQDKA